MMPPAGGAAIVTGTGLLVVRSGKGEVMATLVAIGYPDEATAEAARQTVAGLGKDLIIQAGQIAAIRRDTEGKYHITTTRGGASAGGGAVWGGFWGFLFGLIFFVPFAGLATGAGFGALFGEALKGYGGTVIKTSLSEEDTQKLQEALTPTETVGATS